MHLRFNYSIATSVQNDCAVLTVECMHLFIIVSDTNCAKQKKKEIQT